MSGGNTLLALVYKQSMRIVTKVIVIVSNETCAQWSSDDSFWNQLPSSLRPL